MSAVDTVKPGSKWVFDAAVAKCFDDMLARSIPSYSVMRGLTSELALEVLNAMPPRSRAVVDLGASRGGAIADLVQVAPAGTQFTALEISEPMCAEMVDRFRENNSVTIVQNDLRQVESGDYPFKPGAYSVALCVLTLQFVPPEYRQAIMRAVYRSLAPGGAVIFVEKILGATHLTNTLQVKLYYDLKNRNGYTREDIAAKRASLEGVLMPLTAAGNEELLRGAGFTDIDCFFRHLNFAGWVAFKR